MYVETVETVSCENFDVPMVKDERIDEQVLELQRRCTKCPYLPIIVFYRNVLYVKYIIFGNTYYHDKIMHLHFS